MKVGEFTSFSELQVDQMGKCVRIPFWYSEHILLFYNDTLVPRKPSLTITHCKRKRTSHNH